MSIAEAGSSDKYCFSKDEVLDLSNDFIDVYHRHRKWGKSLNFAPDEGYNCHELERAIEYAEERSDVKGVKKILSQIKKKESALDAELHKICTDDNREKFDGLFEQFHSLKETRVPTFPPKTKLFWVAVVLTIPLLGIPIIGIVVMFVNYRKEKEANSRTASERESAAEALAEFHNSTIAPIIDHLDEFNSFCVDSYDEIDKLYLASLSGERKELVLMRREQDEQAQARLRQEQEHHEELKQLTKEQVKLAARSAANSEYLANIERERQRRF